LTFTFTKEYDPALAEVKVYSLVALANGGTVTDVIGYQVPVVEPILSASVKVMLGMKLTVLDELLYHVTLIFSPDRKFLAVPVTPW
jgi:hypothetical protein